MRWEREAWVKLYRREIGSFAMLPLYARALAGELLKFADDDGRLYVGQREAWEAIAKLCGATAGDRRMLRAHIPMLIEDGYLVPDGAHLVIRNMPDAQAKPRRQADAPEVPPAPTFAAADGERTGTNREPTLTEPARTVSEPETNRHEHETKNDSSARNDSGEPLAGACASERSEEIRSTLPTAPKLVPTAPGGQLGLLAMAGQPTPSRPAPTRKQDKSAVEPAHKRYADAYAAGMTDATGLPFTPPTDSHAQHVFRTVLPAHGRDHALKPLTGDALLAWIRASVAEWRRCLKPEELRFVPGLKPANWQAWLDAGRPGVVQPPGRMDRPIVHDPIAEMARRRALPVEDE